MPNKKRIAIRTKKHDKKSDKHQRTYEGRPSIAYYIKENMNMLNRTTHYNRIIFIARHKMFKKTYVDGRYLKKIYEDAVTKCKDVIFDEPLCGLFLLYEDFTTVMLEGTEEVIEIFFMNFSPIAAKLFTSTKVLHSVNNVYQLFFDRIIWRIGTPPTQLYDLTTTEAADIKTHLEIGVGKFYKLCEEIEKRIDKNEISNKMERLPIEIYGQYMPLKARLTIALDSSELFSLEEYIEISQSVPKYERYIDNVWPIPFDYGPKNLPSRFRNELLASQKKSLLLQQSNINATKSDYYLNLD